MFQSRKIIFSRRAIICNICLRTYQNSVRVRFAPSPTGFLHLGGLRTALYNFLFAKKHNGKFILRIEDTDQTRLVPGATQQLEDYLKWAGIVIDEGPNQGGSFGPYLQSQRLPIYQDHIQLLLKSGSAYHCFCTEHRLNLLRKEALKKQEIPKYDNRCRHLTPEEVERNRKEGKSSCIRFKIHDKEESFDDLINGRITCNISLSEGDPIILKSDGYPTYHFANVVDDRLMKISHVLRGVEWQISTTKHILLYKAFGWNPPFYGHLPLLMNSDGTKLSKRQGDIRINHYRETGILPQALINFIVQSGGGFAKDLEKHLKPKCYSMEELTEQFDISLINSHSGKMMDDRLLQYNKLELEKRVANPKDLNSLVKEVKDLLILTYSNRIQDNTLQYDDDHIKNILKWCVPRITKLSDLVSKNLEFVWFLPTETKLTEIDISNVILLKSRLEQEEQLNTDQINIILKEFCKEENIKFAAFMKILRYVLSGLKEGPSIAEMITILGKDNTVDRLNICIKNTKT